MSTPLLLVVAGSDSSRGAGLDADRAATRAFTVDARCVVTAETVQDVHGVRGLGARPAAVWLAEARAALATLPDALKLGLLPGADHVKAAADLVWEARAQLGERLPVVLDPVVRASSGTLFLDDSAVGALLERLLPLGLVLTPNLQEACVLTGVSEEGLSGPDGRLGAARTLLAGGARAVVLKGGHGAEDPVQDLVLAPGVQPVWIERPRVAGQGIRGSGCRFASALAAGLAHGRTLAASARAAGDFVAAEIRAAAHG